MIKPFAVSTDRNTPVGLTGGDLAKPLNAAAAGIPDTQAGGNSHCEKRVFLPAFPPDGSARAGSNSREALVRVCTSTWSTSPRRAEESRCSRGLTGKPPAASTHAGVYKAEKEAATSAGVKAPEDTFVFSFRHKNVLTAVRPSGLALHQDFIFRAKVIVQTFM